MKKTNGGKINPLNEDEIYKRVLQICENDVERDYVFVHRFRFSYIFSKVLPKVKPGMRIANVGISIFDPLVKEILEGLSASYFNLVPDSNFISKLHNMHYADLNTQIIDVCSQNTQFENKQFFDVILFYETMEHLLAPDELIMKNISSIMNSHGLLFGSVPNGLSVERRIDMILGRNGNWPKKDIVNGVFGGYGHIREYAIYEIGNLISNEFRDIKIYDYSSYGNSLRNFTNSLLSSFRSTVFFVSKRATN